MSRDGVMRSSHLIEFPGQPRLRNADRSGGRSRRSGQQPAMTARWPAIALRAAFAAAALLFSLLTIAAPASAQTGPTGEPGPSGTLSVQLQVSDALVEEALDGGIIGEQQSLGGTGSCNIPLGGSLDYGVQKIGPGNTLPPLIAGTTFSFRCNTPVSGGGVPEGEQISVFVGGPSANGNKMTLGGSPNVSGIAYELIDLDSGRPLADIGGAVIGTAVQISSVQVQISGSFGARLIGPTPMGFRPTPGKYLDTLMITYSF